LKQLHELQIPDDRKYSTDHEWAKPAGSLVRVGISDYAQSELGDAVYVELPEVGRILEKDSVFGTVESVKAVSELLTPVGGEVVSVNSDIVDAPQLVNQSPNDKGWMIEIKLRDPGELDSLMGAKEYLTFLQGK
jgi:glycine cleavage system H protein